MLTRARRRGRRRSEGRESPGKRSENGAAEAGSRGRIRRLRPSWADSAAEEEAGGVAELAALFNLGGKESNDGGELFSVAVTEELGRGQRNRSDPEFSGGNGKRRVRGSR